MTHTPAHFSCLSCLMAFWRSDRRKDQRADKKKGKKKSKERKEDEGRRGDGQTEIELKKRSDSLLVKNDFVSLKEDELDVRRGEYLKQLWEDNSWIYAQNAAGNTGFIPQSYVIRVNPPKQLNIRQGASIPSSIASRTPTTPVQRKTPDSITNPVLLLDNTQQPYQSSRKSQWTEEKPAEPDAISLPFGEIIMDDFDVFGRVSDEEDGLDIELDALEQFSKEEDVVTYQRFVKRPSGKYLVLHNFHGEQENDATVFKGDCVTVLNKEDRQWFWVQTAEGREGFVPSSYLWQATCSPNDDFP